jgi:hypothetical protein
MVFIVVLLFVSCRAGGVASEADDLPDGCCDFVHARLSGFSGVAGGFEDAVAYVIVEKTGGDFLGRAGDGGELVDDVGAPPVVGEHLLHAADLTLDAA